MDLLQSIAVGFGTALTLKNVAYCFVGTFVGTMVGVLPGLGPVATISLLLPFSFTMFGTTMTHYSVSTNGFSGFFASGVCGHASRWKARSAHRRGLPPSQGPPSDAGSKAWQGGRG